MSFDRNLRLRMTLTVSSLALFAGAAAMPAYAQDSQPTVVDEIIVTAQKREQSIQDVPLAVSAFRADNL